MYAFVVMALLNGAPQVIIVERGLTAAQCRKMAKRPDNGLRMDGKKVPGPGGCVREEAIPDIGGSEDRKV